MSAKQKSFWSKMTQPSAKRCWNNYLCAVRFCEPCRNRQRGLDEVARVRFDLVLLDVGLPDIDGREICKLMRKQGVGAPILMYRCR